MQKEKKNLPDKTTNELDRREMIKKTGFYFGAISTANAITTPTIYAENGTLTVDFPASASFIVSATIMNASDAANACVLDTTFSIDASDYLTGSAVTKYAGGTVQATFPVNIPSATGTAPVQQQVKMPSLGGDPGYHGIGNEYLLECG